MIRSDKRIESIRLVGIGPFEDCTISFKPNTNKNLAEVHLLTGGNGCGKSTLLYALAAHFSSKGEAKSVDEIAKRMRTKTASISLNSFGSHVSIFQDIDSKRFVLNNADVEEIGDLNILRSEEFKSLIRKWRSRNWRNNEYTVLPIAYSGNRSWGLSLEIADTSLQEVTGSPLKEHLSFSDTIDPWITAQWIANIEVKRALAGNKHKKEAGLRRSKEVVVQFISEIIDQEVDFYLNPETLQVQLKLQGKPVSIDVLPDGLKSIISWIADILMRMDRLPWEDKDIPLVEQPLILFLDEIDIHLHPKWQRKILPVVQKLFPNAQIFVSTHSPFVVGSVEDAWVYKLDEAKNKKVIEGIPSGAGTSYEVLLEEVFGVKEDFDEKSEELLRGLQKERDTLLKDPSQLKNNFTKIANELFDRSQRLDSEELAHLLSFQLRQLKKHGIEVAIG